MMVPEATIPTMTGVPWPLAAELLTNALPRLAPPATLPRLWWVPLLLATVLALVLRVAMAARARDRQRTAPPPADSPAAVKPELRRAA